MRNRSTDLLLVTAFLLALPATIVLGHRDRLAAAAQQQRQAAADACQSQVTAAVQQAIAYRAADPIKVAARSRELLLEARQLAEDKSVETRELQDARWSGVVRPAHLRVLEADVDVDRDALEVALQRLTAALPTMRVPTELYAAEMGRLDANTSRLLARQTKLVAAMSVGATPSRFRPWAIVLTAVLPPAWSIRTLWFHRRRLHRLRNHRCVACDYDLRASPGRCPECGTVAAVPAAGQSQRGVATVSV